MPEPSTIAAVAVASFALLVIPGSAVLFIINRNVADGRTVGLAPVTGTVFIGLGLAAATSGGHAKRTA